MGKELFDNIPSKVGDLLSDVKTGKVGLPDLQRPFVWKEHHLSEIPHLLFAFSLGDWMAEVKLGNAYFPPL